MIVDTHAHLDMKEFSRDLPQVIERAEGAGVGRIITVGIDLKSSEAAISLSERFKAVWAAVGIHPNEADKWDSESLKQLAEMSRHSKVIAIGETGLDFYRRHTPPDLQLKVFREHLLLARDTGLPVIIHARQADKKVLETLGKTGHGLNGVAHCFSGDLGEAREYLNLGMRISLGGPVTYPNASRLRGIFESLPVEGFMVETDCPYLPPQGHRGKRNEPSLIVDVAAKMAEIKGLSFADISRVTAVNACDLFGLDLEKEKGVIAYRIRRSLYLNITNRCPNRCIFCGRKSHYRVKGYDLRLVSEPSKEDVLEAVKQESDFDEVVFCGYGEPLLRMDVVSFVARQLKSRNISIRINTNGLASIIHGRSIPTELRDLVDSYSISLNAPDAETYNRLCQPETGPDSFESALTFIREAVKITGNVTVTAVNVPETNLDSCRELAHSLGARFKIRKLNDIG